MPERVKSLKIVSDGTPDGTYITTPEGKQLGLVKRLQINMEGPTVSCTLEILNTELDLEIPYSVVKVDSVPLKK